MKQFQTTITERKLDFTADFETQPYEAGWAREAICFIRVENMKGEAAHLAAAVQISVDGLRWIDEGTLFQTINSPGDYFVKILHFGGWLRLRGTIKGDDPQFNLTIWWVLKE
jgi:hypothetical protein